MLHVWWFFQDMPRWGRQPGLGIEGTAADYLQWVMEGRLACVDRASRGAPGILHCLWYPGPSRRTGGSYCHPISVSKRHGLTQCPFSLTDQHLQIVSLLISQSINLFNHSPHSLVPHRQGARILTTEAALVSTSRTWGLWARGR